MKGYAMTAAEAVGVIRQSVLDIVPTPADTDDDFGDRVVPFEIRQWMARLRLLEAVPFAYLAADSELLPRESIRFFYLDRAWTDALIQGAMSVGTVNSSDRAELAKIYEEARDEIDEEERRVRLAGGEDVQQGPAGTVTGFLLRSRAVSGWPGLHVRAYSVELQTRDDEIIPESDPRRLKVLRMERLAPAVLLVLFDGEPAVVHIEEPRQGVQFGVRLETTGDGSNSFQAWVPGRDANTSEDVDGVEVPVPFRAGSPGVVDLPALVKSFVDKDSQLHVGTELDSAELALQMIRFPYRQVFGDTSVDGQAPELDTVFRPQIGYRLSELVTTFTRAVRR
ncbi:MAG TPA: hypothetical protein VFR22_11695 [Nocardioidaceae bacterium]|nr:hypothetical protein [Nocardioidaceae bacterium]